MVVRTNKISRSKFNICWISILVIFIGTIIYPISYERAGRKSLANANIKNLIDTITPLPTYEKTAEPAPSIEIVPGDTMLPEFENNAPVAQPAVATEPMFKRDLKMGDSGADVKLLQQALNQRGYIIAESGPGSPGNESTLFGAGTREALIKFQEANAEILLKPYGLTEGTGFFGSATRALFNS